MDPYLERLKESLAAATNGLSPEDLTWHPPGKWSVVEVLEHLFLTYTGTTRAFERVIAADKPLATACSWKQRAGIFLVTRFGYIPSGREAPPTARPKGLAPEKVRAEISQKIGEMEVAIARCEERWGMSTKLLDHPILGPLTGKEWKQFHLFHGRHHLKQIRKLQQALREGK